MKVHSFTGKYSKHLDKVGVYLILLGNGIYIGKTSKSFKERFTTHWIDLNNNTHYNEKCLDSFKQSNKCFFIPIVEIESNSEFNNDLLITTLESIIISHFPIKDLLNRECKAPKENLVKLIEDRYPEIYIQTFKAIEIINKILPVASCSISKIRIVGNLFNYKIFAPNKENDLDDERMIIKIRQQIQKDPRLARKLKDRLINISNNRWKYDNKFSKKNKVKA
jgi:hypothetical protein